MVFIFFLLVAVLALPPSGLPSAQSIISKSIQFHDPNNHWGSLQTQLDFIETRPNKENRSTSVSINNKTGNFCIQRGVGKVQMQSHIVKDSCFYTNSENRALSNKEIEELKLTNENTLFLRNYYLYLWGLPMKLKDPGTIIDNDAKLTQFNGKDGYEVKVTYDAETGSDTWFFYFNPATYALIGYKFYHNLEKGDGEYITLEDNMMVLGINIPQKRSWYTNQDSTFLGTDILQSFSTNLHEHN